MLAPEIRIVDPVLLPLFHHGTCGRCQGLPREISNLEESRKLEKPRNKFKKTKSWLHMVFLMGGCPILCIKCNFQEGT